MASAPNIYPSGQETFPVSLFGRRPTRNLYRAAVKQVVLSIMGEHNLNAEEFAERIGVGEDTIKNAAKEANSLEAVTLLSIAFEFGEEAIDPVRALYLTKPPEEPTKSDLIKRAVKLLSQAEAME
jgi:hypothetical protein